MYAVYCGKTKYAQYPYQEQCIAWLYRHGWVMEGYSEWEHITVSELVNPKDINNKVEIRRIQGAENE